MVYGSADPFFRVSKKKKLLFYFFSKLPTHIIKKKLKNFFFETWKMGFRPLWITTFLFFFDLPTHIIKKIIIIFFFFFETWNSDPFKSLILFFIFFRPSDPFESLIFFFFLPTYRPIFLKKKSVNHRIK